MIGKSKVIISKKHWSESASKDEAKRKIINYVNKNYPDYEILEFYESHVICDTGR